MNELNSYFEGAKERVNELENRTEKYLLGCKDNDVKNRREFEKYGRYNGRNMGGRALTKLKFWKSLGKKHRLPRIIHQPDQ